MSVDITVSIKNQKRSFETNLIKAKRFYWHLNEKKINTINKSWKHVLSEPKDSHISQNHEGFWKI